MRRTLAVVFVLAALVVAFSLGQDRGITLGVEETIRFLPPVIPCTPGATYNG